MNILIIHQNFPGQFKHLGPALVRDGHKVVALTSRLKKPAVWQGIDIIPYNLKRGSSKEIHPWIADLETKVIRGEACYRAAVELRDKLGFQPDVILAHHGWGEPMFVKDVWPRAKLALYCEFFYRSEYPYSDFDPEFSSPDPKINTLRLRLKNLNNLIHQDIADAAISPTEFQANTFPTPWQDKISVIHDGVDTSQIAPNKNAELELPDGRRFSKKDEVITFVNRNLEPYRGYHIFMRALPELLRKRPNATVMIVGSDGVSYGAAPPPGKTWKQIFIDEVRDQISDKDWSRVFFMGHMPYSNFISMLQISSLHVYFTYPFVLSWSLLEAMSAGCAILASDTGPVKEVIEHGKTGRLVDLFDIQAFLDEACHLLDNAEERKLIGAAARSYVVENYDLKTICLPKQMAWVRSLSPLKG